MQLYVIGQSPIPAWCRKQVYQYKRMDGKTGFEFWYSVEGMRRIAELERGDELYLSNDGRIHFRRQVKR